MSDFLLNIIIGAVCFYGGYLYSKRKWATYYADQISRYRNWAQQKKKQPTTAEDDARLQ